MSKYVVDGDFPAEIENKDAWPARYVDGFNDALRLVRDLGFVSRHARQVPEAELLSELMRGLEIPPLAVAHGPSWLYKVGAAIAKQAKSAASPKPGESHDRQDDDA